MKKIAFLLLSIYSIHIDAMHIARYRKQPLRSRIPHCIIDEQEDYKELVFFYTDIPEKDLKNKRFLPTDINDKIFSYMTIKSCAKSLTDAAQRINALAKTNKRLNEVINDDDSTFKLSKGLSAQFGCFANQEVVVRALCTKAANYRFALQRAFLYGWTHHRSDLPVKDFDKMEHMGLDLNFTYDDRQNTLLIKATGSQETGYSDVARWLIESGIDINRCTQTGATAFLSVLATYNKPLIDIFLEHPALDVNHCDVEGFTPLHCCLQGFTCNIARGRDIQAVRFSYVCGVIEKLLAKGANPTVMNTFGKTPLDLAKRTGHQPLIDLLKKAAFEFNFKKNADSVC